MKKSLVVMMSSFSLFTSIFLPIDAANAVTSTPLVTCINLSTKVERISHSDKCRMTQEAQANWHLLNSDTRLPETGKSKTITICANKPTSPVSYQIIRARCAAHQIRTDYYRSTLLATAPVITKVEASGYNSVQLVIARDVNANVDAPVAFYTITTNSGLTKSVYSWGELNLTIDNLSELTTYSFSVSATSADGTSTISQKSDSVTTPKYVAPPAPASAAAPVAQVNLISSETASVTIPAGATSVAVTAPTLGNPSLSFGSQGSPISATIQLTANPAGGSSTPFTVSGSTKIVDISVAGLSGNATVCLDASPTAKLWHYQGGAWVDITTSHTSSQVCGLTSSFSPFTGEETLPAPAFTLSVSSRTGNKDSAIAAVTATKTAHTQTVTYSVSPALPAGLTINSSTGIISGTATVTATATDYVVTATNAAFATATQTISITINPALSCALGGACVLGAVGPAGGTIYYVSADGFNCGRNFSNTGSPTGSMCHYLEMRNADLGSIKICDTSGDNWKTATSSAIGSGYKNTLDQIAALTVRNECLTTSFALGASRATFGGYSDWYVPSLDEARALVSYAFPGGSPPVSPPAPYVAGYWTSSQTGSGSAYVINFVTGFATIDSWQRNGYSPRPIRAF